MKEPLEAFLTDLDNYLAGVAEPAERLDLYQLGGAVLIMHYGLVRGTKDFDIADFQDSALLVKALAWIGKGTQEAKARGIFLDNVPNGLPPLPIGYKQRCTQVEGPWEVVRLWRPEPHDLIVTKLKSFRLQDQQDIQFLCNSVPIDAKVLRERLEKAFLWNLEKDADPDRERAFAHLDCVIAYLEGRSTSI